MSGILAAKLEQLERECRQRQLPLTAQRRTVLEVLLQRSDHPTADAVYEVAVERIPGISRRTVYRVLDTLVEWGIIRRVHHPGAAVRFDARTDRHHHLVCLHCHKILDFENADLDQLPLPRGKLHGFTVSDYSVQLMGVCPDCRARRT